MPSSRCENVKNDFRARQHPAYWAFLVHRISGVALALFLPIHFWARCGAWESIALAIFLNESGVWTAAVARVRSLKGVSVIVHADLPENLGFDGSCECEKNRSNEHETTREDRTGMHGSELARRTGAWPKEM